MCVSASFTSPTAPCPVCHQISNRLHSYYLRSPADLPLSGQSVRLKLRVRRFHCQNQQCVQQTTARALSQNALRSCPTDPTTDRHLNSVCAGAELTNRGTSARPNRDVHQWRNTRTARERSRICTHRYAGSRGGGWFAFRRGKTYGTILVDLETNRPIDLLSEQTGDALADRLRQHPGVKLISRDRSSEYARGASEGAPEVQRIVDRWYVLKILGEVVLRSAWFQLEPDYRSNVLISSTALLYLLIVDIWESA